MIPFRVKIGGDRPVILAGDDVAAVTVSLVIGAADAMPWLSVTGLSRGAAARPIEWASGRALAGTRLSVGGVESEASRPTLRLRPSPANPAREEHARGDAPAEHSELSLVIRRTGEPQLVATLDGHEQLQLLARWRSGESIFSLEVMSLSTSESGRAERKEWLSVAVPIRETVLIELVSA